ncbi:MAG: NCS2 family permease, partial [Chlorobi bacterium]|nr:NCS2 family permease [Chlorobiota bacterium]
LFLVALFFAPILTVVPSYAYGSALIIVGMLMLRPIARLNFDDLTDVIPAFLTIALMSFTYNIGIGMTAGFVIYPIAKLVGGKSEEIHNAMWALFGVSILFYIFYPY